MAKRGGRRANAERSERRARERAEQAVAMTMHHVSADTLSAIRDEVADMHAEMEYGLLDLWTARLRFLGIASLIEDADADLDPSTLSRHLLDQSMARRLEVIDHVRRHPDFDVDLLDIECDEATTRLLASNTIATPDAVVLASLLDEIELVREGAQPICLRIEDTGRSPQLMARVGLGHGLVWENGRITGVPKMTEQLRLDVVGEPLRDVLPHPVLDPLRLTIAAWDEDGMTIGGLEWNYVLAV